MIVSLKPLGSRVKPLSEIDPRNIGTCLLGWIFFAAYAGMLIHSTKYGGCKDLWNVSKADFAKFTKVSTSRHSQGYRNSGLTCEIAFSQPGNSCSYRHVSHQGSNTSALSSNLHRRRIESKQNLVVHMVRLLVELALCCGTGVGGHP